MSNAASSSAISTPLEIYDADDLWDRTLTFGIATIVRSRIGRSTMRRHMNCIRATVSWSTRWKGICWGA